jgi:hypothetical protein
MKQGKSIACIAAEDRTACDQSARAKARINAAYEKAMKACLREMGYGIEE